MKQTPLTFVELGFALLATCALAGAPNAQRYQFLAESTYDGTQELGHPVSVSGDLAMVGLLEEGEVRCYRWGGQVWTQIQTLELAGALSFGAHVHLAEDRAFIGAPIDRVVAAYVFDEIAAAWEFDRFFDHPLASNEFGTALAYEAGSLFIGDSEVINKGPFGGFRGAVFTATLDDGLWSELTELEVPEPQTGSFGARFGDAIAVRDGTLAITDPSQGGVLIPGDGALYLFECDAQGVWLFDQKIVGPSDGNVGFFGREVALDGGQLIVSAIGAGSISPMPTEPGRILVYARDGGPWSLQQTIQEPFLGLSTFFSSRFAVSGDLMLASTFCTTGFSMSFFFCGVEQSLVSAYLRDDSGVWSSLGALKRPVRYGDVFAAGLDVDQGRALFTTVDMDEPSTVTLLRVFGANLSKLTE